MRTINLLNAVSFFLPPPPPAEDFARRKKKGIIYPRDIQQDDSENILFFAGFSTSALEAVRVAIVQRTTAALRKRGLT
jgi:hypothetical protein